MSEVSSDVSSLNITGKVLNVNVGIMGHVDSGKTSLARALSTTLSTAALDKHPQSQERGITLDLGFSSFTIPLPEHLQASCGSKFDTLQFTLVDCPGHASLIRTIIGGAQIIDLMMLVIDVSKGIQTQTAECLVIGEILMDNMLVILNKIDQFPEDQREERLEKTRRGLQKVLCALCWRIRHMTGLLNCARRSSPQPSSSRRPWSPCPPRAATPTPRAPSAWMRSSRSSPPWRAPRRWGRRVRRSPHACAEFSCLI